MFAGITDIPAKLRSCPHEGASAPVTHDTCMQQLHVLGTDKQCLSTFVPNCWCVPSCSCLMQKLDMMGIDSSCVTLQHFILCLFSKISSAAFGIERVANAPVAQHATDPALLPKQACVLILMTSEGHKRCAGKHWPPT